MDDGGGPKWENRKNQKKRPRLHALLWLQIAFLLFCVSWWIESRLSNKAAKFAKHSQLRIEVKLRARAVPLLGARNAALANIGLFEGKWWNELTKTTTRVFTWKSCPFCVYLANRKFTALVNEDQKMNGKHDGNSILSFWNSKHSCDSRKIGCISNGLDPRSS